MNFRQSLLIGASALALNATAAGVAILIPERALASCLTVSSNTTITDSSTNCITWDSSNISITNAGSLTGSITGISNTGNTVGSLTNSGIVNGSSLGLNNTGTITGISNLTGGSISGSNTGIHNSGTIGTISNSGLITGTTNGINATGGSIGAISNSGTISSHGVGIRSAGDIGTITNNGIIIGYGGIYNSGTLGTIINSGSIVAEIYQAVLNSSGGSIGVINNTIGGVISGGYNGVFNSNGATINTITNSGSISGSYGGITNLGGIGAIINNGGGVISNAVGGTTTGAISNNGSIGTLTNNGTISGHTVGIYNSTGSTIGTLTNSGLITGSIAGINNAGTIGTGSIGINNTGTISGITNSGLITGTTWGIISAAGSIGVITNASGGNITGGLTGINITNTTIGAISNSGTITGLGGDGIFNYNLGAGNASIGLITNIAGATIVGATGGIANYNATIGTISNSGIIKASNAGGTFNYGIYNITGYIGLISNASGGTISGVTAGINNGGTIGEITNNGLITGTTTGINNTGTIGSGNSFGILNTSAGSISALTNSNLISGTVIGIGNEGGHIGTITNSGTISGLAASHEALYDGGTIGLLSNSGVLTGAAGIYIKTGGIGSLNNASGGIITGTTSVGIINGSTIGTITNSGTISGANGGIYNGGSIGSIANNGLITGANYGISNTGTIGGGTIAITNNTGGTITAITNSGTIIGTNTGILNNTGGTIGTISNSGTISGTSAEGIYNNGGSIGTLENLAGATISGIPSIYNTGTIGTINNLGAIHSVDSAIVNTGTIGSLSNSGTISGIIGISDNGTIGTLTNNRSAIISGGSTGLFIDPGKVTTLINNGTITGGVAAIANNTNGSGGIATIVSLTNTGLISGPTAISSSGTILNAISNPGTIAGNINVNQDLTITGGNSGTLGTLTGYNGGAGTITATNLIFDSNAYQLLNEDVNVGSGMGTLTNSGTLQLNSAHAITGNYTQGTGGTLAIGVTNASSYGNLTISGNASMAGDHVAITPIVGSLSTGETFTIVQADTANYSGITATARGFTTSVTSTITGGDDDLLVTLTRPSDAYHAIGIAAGSGLAAGVGTALDQLAVNNNPAYTNLLNSIDNLGAGSPAQISAIKQLAPSQIAAMQATSNFLMNENIHVISQHQQALLSQAGDGSTGQAAGSDYQTGMFWGQVSGGFANRDSTGDTDGFHQSFGGFSTGADDHLNENATVGLAVGWMQGRATGFDSLAGSNITTNSVQLTGYGTEQFGPAFVNAMAGASYNIFNQGRYVSLVNASANSNYDGLQYLGRIDGGWNFPVASYVFTPLAGIQAIRTQNSSYTESGANVADLSVGRLDATTATTLLGAQASTKVATSWGTFLPEAKLEWEHDLTQGPISSSALLGGVSFSTETPRESPNGVLLTLDATLQRTEQLSLKVEYDGDIRSNYASHVGLIKAGWNF